MSHDALEHASDFSSATCPAGLVAVAGNTLRIVFIENLGAMYNQTTLPLRYTPRKMCRLGASDMVIIETDHNEFNAAERAEVEKRYAAALSGSAVSEGGMEVDQADASAQKAASEDAEEEEEEGTVLPVRGPLPATEGRWASCVRVLDVATGATKALLELANNEAAFSVTTCRFSQHSEETFIVVGTVKDLTLHPKKWSQAYVLVYRLLGDSLQLLHRTEVEDIPMSMIEFQGRLLVGIGRCLRLYDLGKRKLLKKCENKTLPVAIARLQTSGDRIFVGDLMESVLFVKYRKHENVLVVFADEAATRYVFVLPKCFLVFFIWLIFCDLVLRQFDSQFTQLNLPLFLLFNFHTDSSPRCVCWTTAPWPVSTSLATCSRCECLTM